MDRTSTRRRRGHALAVQAFAAAVPTIAGKLFDAYRPERHYMRGPGPKSLAMIGRRFQRETQSITQELLPEGWHELIRALEKDERGRSGQRAETKPHAAPRYWVALITVVRSPTCPHRRLDFPASFDGGGLAAPTQWSNDAFVSNTTDLEIQLKATTTISSSGAR